MPRIFERNELSRRWSNLQLSPLTKKMIEIYTVSIASAAFFTSIYFVGVLPQEYIWCVFCSAACVFLNFIWLAFRVKRSMDSGMEIGECRRLYLKVFAIHACVNLLMTVPADIIPAMPDNFFEPVYTFMFLPYKLFCFGVLPRTASAVIMNGVFFLANFYFPAVPLWLERMQKKPIKRNAVKMRKLKKIGGTKKKTKSKKIKRRTVKFSRRGGKKR